MPWLFIIKIAALPLTVLIIFLTTRKRKDAADLAWNAKEKGDFEHAIDLYDAIIAAEPKNWMLLFHRGKCKAAMGNKEGALEDFELAITIAPNYTGLVKAERDKLIGK